MLAKCSNPGCSSTFRFLQNGRLYRLDADPRITRSALKKMEYYWLCEHCASLMTLRIAEDGGVVVVSLPAPLKNAPVGMQFSERKGGLWLRSMHLSLSHHGRHGARDGWVDGRDVA